MKPREFHDGAEDGLEALEPLNPETIKTFSDLLGAMRKTAFGGRRLGEAFEVLGAMVEDPDCTVVLTLSGAMTIAGNEITVGSGLYLSDGGVAAAGSDIIVKASLARLIYLTGSAERAVGLTGSAERDVSLTGSAATSINLTGSR